MRATNGIDGSTSYALLIFPSKTALMVKLSDISLWVSPHNHTIQETIEYEHQLHTPWALRSESNMLQEPQLMKS